MEKTAPDNIDEVFRIFEKNYKTIPLEVFKTSYEIFVSTLLSSRTNDDTTLEVCNRLFKVAPSIQELIVLTISEISNLIYPVGFYKTKAVNLKYCAHIINDKYGGNVPDKRSDLLDLPGVGIKTANLVLSRAYNQPAISVDTHVHRISNILGWVDTKTPENTLVELEKLLPQKYWKDTNRLFVSIGRQYTTKPHLEKFLRENSLLK